MTSKFRIHYRTHLDVVEKTKIGLSTHQKYPPFLGTTPLTLSAIYESSKSICRMTFNSQNLYKLYPLPHKIPEPDNICYNIQFDSIVAGNPLTERQVRSKGWIMALTRVGFPCEPKPGKQVHQRNHLDLA